MGSEMCIRDRLGKVEKELKRMKVNGVIEEVTEPTEWVSPIVPVLKPSGDVRICVNLKKLNQSVERERCHSHC